MAVAASRPSRVAMSSLAAAESGRPRRMTAQRLRMVGRSEESSAAARMMCVCAGGSSRVFSSAFCAGSLIRSARSMSATRRPPSTGRRARLASSSRIGVMPISSAAPLGEIRARSAWLSAATSLHARHSPHAPPLCGLMQRSVAATSRASVPAPAPRGPTISRACGGTPVKSCATRDAAAS